MNDADWSNTIATRVNCYGVADWLRLLAGWLEVNPHRLIPVNPASKLTVEVPDRGLQLLLRHPHAGLALVADPDRWVLEQAIFRPPDATLPFGLDAKTETPDSAQAKLSDEVIGPALGDSRASYFLDDGRVVELTFGENLIGVTRVWIVRLGQEVSYADLPGGSV